MVQHLPASKPAAATAAQPGSATPGQPLWAAAPHAGGTEDASATHMSGSSQSHSRINVFVSSAQVRRESLAGQLQR